MQPLLKALVDRTWKNVFVLNSESRDGETRKFEQALPEHVRQDISLYKSDSTQHFRNLAQLRERFNDFAEEFFVEDNEADLVRSLACVLGYMTSDQMDVLHSRHDSSACRRLEVSDSPLHILHHCGEGAPIALTMTLQC